MLGRVGGQDKPEETNAVPENAMPVPRPTSGGLVTKAKHGRCLSRHLSLPEPLIRGFLRWCMPDVDTVPHIHFLCFAHRQRVLRAVQEERQKD